MSEREQDGRQHGPEIGTGIAEGAAQCRQINQGDHRHNNGRRQRRLGQPGYRRREEQGRQGNAHRRVGTGGRCFCAGIEVHHRTGKATDNRHTARQAGPQVGGPQTNQLLVRVNALAPFGRQGLTHRNRFHETHHTDQQGADRQLGPQAKIQTGHGEGRQS